MTDTPRSSLLARLSRDMTEVAERGDELLQVVGEIEELSGANSTLTVFCASPAHPERDVVTLVTNGLLSRVGGAMLDERNEVVPTLREALLGASVRSRYRLQCPECGDRGEVVEFRQEFLAEKLSRLPALGVSRVDLRALQRYISG